MTKENTDETTTAREKRVFPWRYIGAEEVILVAFIGISLFGRSDTWTRDDE